MSGAVLQQGWEVWVCCCTCLTAQGDPCWAEHNKNFLSGWEIELYTHLKASAVQEESKDSALKQKTVIFPLCVLSGEGTHGSECLSAAQPLLPALQGPTHLLVLLFIVFVDWLHKQVCSVGIHSSSLLVL